MGSPSPAAARDGRRPAGLRTRLLLLVALSVAPAFVLIGHSAWEGRARALADAELQTRQLALLVAQDQQRIFARAEQLLQTLANLPLARDPDMLPRCAAALARLRARYPYYANIGMVDARGELLCSALPFTPPVDFADRAWFRRAVATRGTGIGDYLVGRLTGVPSVGLAVPAFDDEGSVSRVLYATIDLAWLQSRLGARSLPAGTAALVVDAAGTVLARHPDPQHAWIGEPAPDAQVAAGIVAAGCRGTAQLGGVDGVARLGAFEPLQAVDGNCVHVRVGVPLEAIHGPITDALWRNLATLLGTTVLVFAIAWFGARWLVLRRVQALDAAARRLGAGDLDARAGLPHDADELGRLAAAFDEMATGIQAREARIDAADRALTRANRALTVLNAGNRAMLRATDEQALVDDMCRMVVEKAGYRIAWAGYPRQDEAHSIQVVAHAGIDVEQLDPRCLTWSEAHSGISPVGAAVRSGHPEVFRAEPEGQTLSCMAATGCRAALALPLNGPVGAYGVLAVYADEADAFDDAEIDLLHEAAADLAYGIASLRDQVRSRQADEIEDLYNRAPCGYHSLDAEGRFLRVNDTELSWLGYAREELVGRIRFADLLTPDSRDSFEDGFAHFKAQGWMHDLEFDMRRRDGSVLPVVVSATAIYDAGGSYVSSRSTVFDATDRRRADAALRMAKEAAEQATRVKSEFLANMSHELRTPLNAIIGFSEVLKDGVLGELSDAQREYVTDIFESGGHLLSLINDILDLSKIEAGRMTLDLEATDLDQLLANALSIVKEKAAAHHIALMLETPGALGSALVDPRKTKQIVYNLLSNAVKFTPEGGHVTLAARRATRGDIEAWSSPLPTVHRQPLPAVGHEQFLAVSVEDNGIGIDATDVPRLFQAFSQLDSTLAREHEGTGLGLLLVLRLAELHGGTVAVASGPHQGSIFTVWLPWRAAACAEAGPTRHRPATEPPGAALALVIEDNAQAAELMQLQLSEAGFLVQRTASAEEALAMVDVLDPALIVLDILLPGMDGWDFLAQIKHAPSRWQAVPVVIVSIVADSQRGFSLGAAQVLQKPVARSEFAAALRRLNFPSGDGRTSVVLVVDDDPKAVELFAAQLSSPAYDVLRAYNGAEAIETARRELPELIVLDLMMPGTNGFEVAEALKCDAATAAIPIIVVTARQLTAEDRARLNGYGAAIIEKASFNHGRFIGEVRRALRASQEAQP